jgi:hypothetical protein
MLTQYVADVKKYDEKSVMWSELETAEKNLVFRIPT